MANFIPAHAVREEIRASNSRFIASLAPAESVHVARAYIAAIRAEMPDATHHVYAYVIGHGATTTLGTMASHRVPQGALRSPCSTVVGWVTWWSW
jgi:putative IMPACT (imprinted ancient) family translation regulator